jgi:3-oxoacyl-[acyl-carrier-protein] synthase II
MIPTRVVITGLGVIASNGIGKDRFQEALFKGVSGIRPVSLFDTSQFKVKTGGEIENFEAADFLGSKGLRTLDRSTKLLNCAAKLALDDAKLDFSGADTSDVGVAVGSTLGSIRSIREFHQDAVKDGPRYVNPSLFPNTVINSPASQVSIRFKIKGFNITLSTGFSAGLDAVNYAAEFIRSGRARVALAGGVEEMCIETFFGFYRTGFLAGSSGEGPELSCPFDGRHNGVVFGEGTAILVLEGLDSAIKRNASIYGEVLGCGRGYDAYNIGRYDPEGGGLKRAMRTALKKADVVPENIDYICAAANSAKEGDIIESKAIKDVFGVATKTNISSIKSMIGESFSASGAFQAAAAALAIEKQVIPATINYRQKDPECDLNYVANEARGCKVDNVLVNAFGPGGYNSSMVIARFNG